MKYYKLILNNEIIGIADSDSFIKFSPPIESFLRADEETGEFINWRGQFYRATWMKPIKFQLPYTSVQVLNIEKNEYDAFVEAFKTNDTIAYKTEEPDPLIIDDFVNPVDVESMAFIKEAKIKEMSFTCNQIIEAGFDIELSDGETHHFSLTTQDQLNLISLSAMAANGMEAIPYHADGEICRFYSNQEMTSIVEKATAFKIYHTTYYNALKNYINSLDDIESIAAITYGIELPEEYQSDVLKTLQQ